jgi:hypothetical protein
MAGVYERCAPKVKAWQGLSWPNCALAATGISRAALCCVAPFLLAEPPGAPGLDAILNGATLMRSPVVFAAATALGCSSLEQAVGLRANGLISREEDTCELLRNAS